MALTNKATTTSLSILLLILIVGTMTSKATALRPTSFAACARAAASRRAATIKDTGKTKNLEIMLHPSSKTKVSTSERCLPSLDEMEDHLRDVGSDMEMYVSHITVLGRKRYPGNRHWHFKRSPTEPGCLDVTYWPLGSLMWISMRNCEPDWVHTAGPELKERMEQYLLGGSVE